MRSNKGLGRSYARKVREQKYLDSLVAKYIEEVPYYQRKEAKAQCDTTHWKAVKKEPKVVVSNAQVKFLLRVGYGEARNRQWTWRKYRKYTKHLREQARING